jgi:hypothetical protein
MKHRIQLTESQLLKLVRKVLNETEDEVPYEKGKSGMRGARSKADFEPQPKESEIMKTLFGKYENDIPPIVVRYLRKLGKKELTKRLIDLNMIDPETVVDEFDIK